MEIEMASISVESFNVSSNIKLSTSLPSSSVPEKQIEKKRNFKFIRRLTEMLNSTKHFDVISWSEDGCTFIIKDDKTFINKVLPIYFKHCSMPNFVRQLNMYDFKKVKRGDSSVIEYKNSLFKKNQASLSLEINRKTPNQHLTTKIETNASHIPPKNCEFEENNIINSSTLSEQSGSIFFSKQFDTLKAKIDSLECKVSKIESMNKTLFEDKSKINFSNSYISRLEALILKISNQVLTKTELGDLVGNSSFLDNLKAQNSDDLSSASVKLTTEQRKIKPTSSYLNKFSANLESNFNNAEAGSFPKLQLLSKKRHITNRVKPDQKLCRRSIMDSRVLNQDNQVSKANNKSNVSTNQNIFISTDSYFSENATEIPTVKPLNKKYDYDFDLQGITHLFNYNENDASTNQNSREPKSSDTELFNWTW